MLMRSLLCAVLGAVCLPMSFVGCDRPAVIAVTSNAPRAKAASCTRLLPNVATAIHVPRQARSEPPTIFLSAEQLQAVDQMRIDHLTLESEVGEDRELREHQAAQRAEYAARVAPVDHPAEVDDALEAMVRFYFRQALAGKQPTKVSLLIRGRRPSEKFLQRFAGEKLEFNRTKFPKNPYAWQQF